MQDKARISFHVKSSSHNKSAYALQREEEERRAREQARLTELQQPTVISLEAGELKLNDESVTRKEEKKLYVIPLPAAATTSYNSLPKRSDAGEVGEDADYDEVPLGEFGLAFLRGCGWRKEVGIGRTNARRVKLRLPKPRPDRMGCGWKEGRDKKRDKQLVKKRKRKHHDRHQSRAGEMGQAKLTTPGVEPSKRDDEAVAPK